MREIPEQICWMFKKTAKLACTFDSILKEGIERGASVNDAIEVMMCFACTLIDTVSDDYGFNASEVASKVVERVYNLTEGGDI